MVKRTTLTLDDAVDAQLKHLAAKRNVTLKEITNVALRVGLVALERGEGARPYRLTPRSMGSPAPGINLDQANALSDAIEDEAILARLRGDQ